MQEDDCLENCILLLATLYLARVSKDQKRRASLEQDGLVDQANLASFYVNTLHTIIQCHTRILICTRELLRILPVSHVVESVHVYSCLCSLSQAQLLRTDISICVLTIHFFKVLTAFLGSPEESSAVYSSGVEKALSQTNGVTLRAFLGALCLLDQAHPVTVYCILCQMLNFQHAGREEI